MTVRLLAAAESELVAAVDWYNSQSPGLGFAFAAEVRDVLRRIADNPYAWHPLSPTVRRCRTRRFPYGVVYQVREGTIVVAAVMHLHRSPERWEDLLPDSP